MGQSRCYIPAAGGTLFFLGNQSSISAPPAAYYRCTFLEPFSYLFSCYGPLPVIVVLPWLWLRPGGCKGREEAVEAEMKID